MQRPQYWKDIETTNNRDRSRVTESWMFKYFRNGGETTAPRRNRKQSNPNAKLGGHASIVSEAKKNSVQVTTSGPIWSDSC